MAFTHLFTYYSIKTLSTHYKGAYTHFHFLNLTLCQETICCTYTTTYTTKISRISLIKFRDIKYSQKKNLRTFDEFENISIKFVL